MRKIMIADDSATDRKMLVGVLGSLGYDLLEATDGEDTENKFFKTRPDILILDVVMPKKDGYQICREIKSNSEFSNIPIIMISAKTEKSDQYWGLKQGADEYLCKPLDMDILIEKIKQHLD